MKKIWEEKKLGGRFPTPHGELTKWSEENLSGNERNFLRRRKEEKEKPEMRERYRPYGKVAWKAL